MSRLLPVYTEPRECHDCYKCVRNCPVKAIKLENGIASVMPEQCVLCGRCVQVCPSGAKKVRDDLARARQVLRTRPRVYVSLAPSFASELGAVSPGQLVAALRRLGFAGVSETALGAQLVSAEVARQMAAGPPRLLLSSACTAAVSWLARHRTGLASAVTPVLSPVLAHCKLLRATYGAEIGVVFIGPCIAKKAEADAHPELLDAALTFAELRRWLEQEKIGLDQVEAGAEDRFVPEDAREGAIYPVDGGMIAGIRAQCSVADESFMAFSGLRNIERALEGLEAVPLSRSLFVELLACPGGCVNGPQCESVAGTVGKRRAVLGRLPAPAGEGADPGAAGAPEGRGAARPRLDLWADIAARPVVAASWREAQIREVLRSVGKHVPEDELNCSGCGYDSCRDFARALLDGKAERSMCVTYMRKLASKKANALIRSMPSAVVIVDAQSRIIECNKPFVHMVARPELGEADREASLEGVTLEKVLPFASLFSSVLKTGQDLLDRDLRLRDSILHGSIFVVEPHCVVGGIFQDVTRPSVQKDQVIRKAQEVIRKNLETVQKIAYLLGENASESEIILDSIIQSFTSKGAVEDEEPAWRRHDWKRPYRG